MVKVEGPVEEKDERFPMCKVGGSSLHPNTVHVNIIINGRNMTIEEDTGVAVTIISERVKDAVFPSAVLQESSLKLTTSTGERMPVLGQIKVDVQYGYQQKTLDLTVVAG